MTTKNRPSGFGWTLLESLALAWAALAAPAAGHAQESQAQGSVSVGAAVLSGDSADRAIFGQYNGLRVERAYGLLEFGYFRHNPSTGVQTQFRGVNLLGETRELGFVWKKQGDWKFLADYSELVRREPFTVNTGLIGAGTTRPQVVHLAGGVGSGSELDLKTKRQGLGLAYSRWLSPSIEIQASIKSEDKDGARLFGAGFACPSPVAPGCAFPTGASVGGAVLLLPEPINSNHSQLETRLSYAGDKLRLSGGYYGSFYNNSNGALTPGIPGSLNNPVGAPMPLGAGLQGILGQSIALPPDNQAHHVDITGLYAFTPTTRATFKLGYARATQDQSFLGAGLSGAPAGITNLGGKIDTTLGMLGLASRPLPKLSLLAELRYDDRDDKTPIALYNIEGASTYTNRHLPFTKIRGKLQTSYQFTSDYRGTAGADYESIDRGAFTSTSAVSGISALRQKTEEVGYRLELRRRMSESFSGAISVITSKRDGSTWLSPNSGLGVSPLGDPGAAVLATSVFIPSLADRQRDKIRLFAVWQPLDELTLQFSAEDGRDKYTTPSEQGLRSTDMDLFSFDWDYAYSERWTLNGYLSQGNQKLNQSRPGGYVMAFDNTSTSIGVGVVGKPTSKLDVGGGVSYFNDKNIYAQTLDPTANLANVGLLNATGGLPDIVFRTTEWRLFGRYKLSGGATLRLDLIHHRAKFNDWAYAFNGVPFAFSDNTTLTQQRSQNVTFVGLSYIYQWQ